jgi:NAD(P)-dependent dehydrogenase (short-subunit alcohol dehydrogenase family)
MKRLQRGDDSTLFSRITDWIKPADFTNLDDNAIEEDWDRCFNMKVKSHLFLMHAASEHLEATKGTLIMTASVAGVVVSGSSVVSVLAV